MTNQDIIWIMRAINNGKITWDEVRGLPHAEISHLWQFLNRSGRFQAHKSYDNGTSRYITHWTFKGIGHGSEVDPADDEVHPG